MNELGALVRQLAVIAAAAGRRIMAHYRTDIEVRSKADRSPVTAADEEAEDIILAALRQLCPDIPVISEEASAKGVRPEIGRRFFLVDPLDGTKEFLSRNGEFTVNIALIEDGMAIAGMVYAPALAALYGGDRTNGAFRAMIDPASPAAIDEALAASSPIHARVMPRDGMVAVASRSHRDSATDHFLKDFNIREFRTVGSSLKFCLVAAGEADIYPRHGRTMEWDTAAGHAVLAAAGGSVTTLDGATLRYGKRDDDFANPFFVAWGRKD